MTLLVQDPGWLMCSVTVWDCKVKSLTASQLRTIAGHCLHLRLSRSWCMLQAGQLNAWLASMEAAVQPYLLQVIHF